jgi:hypothetical protein
MVRRETEEDMGATELSSKELTCRKEHRCAWCGEQMDKGEKAHYRSGLYEGDFFSEHWHPECWTAMLSSDLGYDDEFYPMDQQRGKTYDESHA